MLVILYDFDSSTAEKPRSGVSGFVYPNMRLTTFFLVFFCVSHKVHTFARILGLDARLTGEKKDENLYMGKAYLTLCA